MYWYRKVMQMKLSASSGDWFNSPAMSCCVYFYNNKWPVVLDYINHMSYYSA